ncbi:hypothetical protein MMC22_008289 [Lobaria immixta]|nr:hypothetical protein [Lobaria immixta]
MSLTSSSIYIGSRPRKVSPQLVERKTSLGKRELLKKRTLDDPKIYDRKGSMSWNRRSTTVVVLAGGALRNKFYILEYVDHCGYIRKADAILVEEFPGINLDHKHTGRLSTATTKPFEKIPMRLFLAGLFGCVSLIVVSEMGVWFSHYWEAPSFLGGDDRFQREDLSTIRDGDLEDPIRMPGLIPLGKDGKILSPEFNVKIFISMPKTRDWDIKKRLNPKLDLLTKSWPDIKPVVREYSKPASEDEERHFVHQAYSKVLIEYDNDQEYFSGEEPSENQQAIYRVWLEDQIFEHHWDAKPGIQKDTDCPFLDQNQTVKKLIEDAPSPPSGNIDKVEVISE